MGANVISSTSKARWGTHLSVHRAYKAACAMVKDGMTVRKPQVSEDEGGEEEEARKTSEVETRESSPVKFSFNESDKSSFKLRQETSTKREK